MKPSNGTTQNGANNVQFIPVIEKPPEKQKSPNVNERRISFRGKIHGVLTPSFELSFQRPFQNVLNKHFLLNICPTQVLSLFSVVRNYFFSS